MTSTVPKKLAALRRVELCKSCGNDDPVALPRSEVTTEIGFFQVDSIPFKTFVEKNPKGLKRIGFTGPVFADEGVNPRRETKLCLDEVPEISYAKLSNVHEVACKLMYSSWKGV